MFFVHSLHFHYLDSLAPNGRFVYNGLFCVVKIMLCSGICSGLVFKFPNRNNIYCIYIQYSIYIVHICLNPSTNHQHQSLRRFSLPLPSGELALTTEVCPLLPVPCNLRISLRRLGKDYNMASACDPQVVKWLGCKCRCVFFYNYLQFGKDSI